MRFMRKGNRVRPLAALDELAELYRCWDEAEERDRDAWPGAFGCPGGCARCCEQAPAVPVTPLEALVVAEAVRRLDEPLRSRVRGRLAETAAQSAGLTAPPVSVPGEMSLSLGLNGPCPLLEEGRCAVYTARPLVCRAFGFAAEERNIYFGCELLAAVVRSEREMRLPSLRAALGARPEAMVLDNEGRALPPQGVLAEMVVRLLEPAGH